MNNLPKPELIAAGRRRLRSIGAFTLTELLAVLGITAVLAGVLLSVAFTTRERALQAECVDNLRQIGVAINLYATEANGYVPICGWANPPTIGGGLSVGNPWQTYQIARCGSASSTNYILGFENLGLLFRTKVLPDGKTFYCPSTALISSLFSYDAYANTATGWPASATEAISFGNPFIRAGYSYYPQLRATERLDDASYGPVILPKLTSTSVQLEFGGSLQLVTPAKLTALDPQKSITTDLVNSTAQLSNCASGSVVGLNALFPDGRVTFQTVRGHNAKGSYEPFDPRLWEGPGPADDPTGFRLIMNGWTP